MNKKILIIIAHPDDELLSMWWTIKKLISSWKEISILLLSKPWNARIEDNFNNRLEKFREVTQKLKISNLYFENFPDTSFDSVRFLDIIKRIEETLDIVKPEIVYTHFYNDLNIDHSITSKAVITALRPIEKYSFVKKIFLFEVSSSTELWIGNERFSPNYYEDISEFINNKVELLNLYKSEMRDFPHPRSKEWIETLAKYRWMESWIHFAEAFMLYRAVN